MVTHNPQPLHRRALLSLLLLALLPSCTATRPDLFDDYRNSFASVKSTATDLYLTLGHHARELADDPDNADPVATRLDKLAAREAALQARLDALETIDTLNAVLAHLAAGKDPESAKHALQGALDSAASLSSRFKSLLSNVSPYTALISEGIALVDTAIHRNAYKRAIHGSTKIIDGLVAILLEDSRTALDLTRTRLAKQQTAHEKSIRPLRLAFVSLVNDHATSDELTARIATLNQLGASIKNIDGTFEFAALTHTPPLLASAAPPTGSPTGPGAPAAGPIDTQGLALLTQLTDQIADHAAQHHQITQRYSAYQNLITAYQASLEETKNTYTRLDAALQRGLQDRTNRVGLVLENALAFRRAYIVYQETR